MDVLAKNASSLSTLPNELKLKVFCDCSNFDDVFALAVTERTLNLVYKANVPTVWEHVAPRCIKHLGHARQLLADGGGAERDSRSVTSNDIHEVLKNQRMVQNAISHFEQDLGLGLFDADYWDERSISSRPSKPLTLSERSRFINFFYKYRGLLLLCERSPKALHERLQTYNLRQCSGIKAIMGLTGTFTMIHCRNRSAHDHAFGLDDSRDPKDILDLVNARWKFLWDSTSAEIRKRFKRYAARRSCPISCTLLDYRDRDMRNIFIYDGLKASSWYESSDDEK